MLGRRCLLLPAHGALAFPSRHTLRAREGVVGGGRSDARCVPGRWGVVPGAPPPPPPPPGRRMQPDGHHHRRRRASISLSFSSPTRHRRPASMLTSCHDHIFLDCCWARASSTCWWSGFELQQIGFQMQYCMVKYRRAHDLVTETARDIYSRGWIKGLFQSHGINFSFVLNFSHMN
jgi:hypothetical protein